MKRTSWQETKKIQSKLATICDNNEQKQGAKNNAELQTKLKETTWKTVEENIRQGRNRSMEA